MKIDMKKRVSLLACIGLSVMLFSFCSEGRGNPAIVTPGGGDGQEEPGGIDPVDAKLLVILKLDDVVSTPGKAISDYWTKAADFLEARKVRAAFGIIGFSLEEDNPNYFNWIKDRASRGYVEFWNHGYKNRTSDNDTGEFEGTYEEQVTALRRTTDLAREKLGLDLVAWGPNWSATNEHTDRALAQVPEIKFAFGYPTQPLVHYRGFLMPRNVNLEHPTHNPDFDAFKKDYNANKDKLEYFFLQGHPCSWTTDVRWDNFVRIVDFLRNEDGVCFVTPSEFLEIMEKRAER